MFKRIDHVEIVTWNLSRTLDFYCDVLGFRIDRRQPGRPGSPWKEIVYLKLGDTMLELLEVPGAESVPERGAERIGYRMMALEVDDMDQAVSYLKTHGVEPSRGPVLLGTSRRAEIKDPNGVSIEIRQW